MTWNAETLVIFSQVKNADDPNFERAHANLMDNTCDLRVEFVKRMMEVKSKMVWDDEKLTDMKEGDEGEDESEDGGFIEDYITPGGVIRLPVNTHTKSIRAMYVRQKNEEKSSYVRSMQKKLCRVLSLCDQVSTVNIDITKTKDLYGYSYIELEINEDARALLNATSIDFELQIEIDNKQLVRKRFSLNCRAKRTKRASLFDEYKPWSYWTHRSVGFESYFPDYVQHLILMGNQSCYVDSAAVAWAMVFGYYDRRAHYRYSVYEYGSQPLYCCSHNGVYGNSACVAPAHANTSRIRNYIAEINKELGTWCQFYKSGTPAQNMDNVTLFFQAHQMAGNPTILQTNDFWSEQATAKIAAQSRAWIDAEWPVVVGTNEGNVFIKHYSVMTRYRTRTRWWRHCLKPLSLICTRCLSWTKTTDVQMHVHQGVQARRPIWRPMNNIHYAAIAHY